MLLTEPKIFIIAESGVDNREINAMLDAIGVKEWSSAGASETELIVELAGRVCYKSFGVGLNKNVTKVREGNKGYIENILKTKHGSVLEHVSTTVAFINVSRIFTHELVRHRAGMAYSQESMRFVRLDDIPIYIPDLTQDAKELVYEDDEQAQLFQTKFSNAMQGIANVAEALIKDLSAELDKPGVPFSIKKKITSALRRMAPGGHTTNIIATGNHRAWRNIIELRTHPSAEEEIRKVFDLVAKRFKEQYPNLYQDMTPIEDPSGVPSWTFLNSKV